MQIHELEKVYKTKRIKRIGRGGKRGTYSGRGQKGQRSRSGHVIRPAERDLVMRLPKLRGVKNKSRHPRAIVFSTSFLAKLVDKEPITRDLLIKKGLLNKKSRRVKILSAKDLKEAITIQGLAVSIKAKNQIEKAGGMVK